MRNTLALRDLPSGQTLRRFRQKLASLSSGSLKSSVLTSKFTLEFTDRQRVNRFLNFDENAKLYDVIEGCQKGSLTYFLFAVHLAGFRLFPDATKTLLFANRECFDEEAFAKAMTELAGEAIPSFTIASLLKAMKTTPRSPKGEPPVPFTEERILFEYRKKICPKLPKGASEDNVNGLIQAMATELLNDGFTDWNDVAKRELEAATAVDRALAKYGEFPSLATMVKATQSGSQLPKNSTIVFDKNLPFIAMKDVEGVEQYAVVAKVLGYAEGLDVVNDHLTTSQGDALSWLFNKGLPLFQTTDVLTLCEYYSVPESQKHRIEQIVEAALAVPHQTHFYKEKNAFAYHLFRTSFAQRTDSWVTNYVKRLQELRDMVKNAKADIDVPALMHDGKDFLLSTDCRREEMEDLVQRYTALREASQQALDHLLGQSALTIQKDLTQVETFSMVLNRMAAITEQLSNAIDQTQEDQFSPWKGAHFEKELKQAGWTNFKRLPKLNGMSGGVPPVQEELEKNATLYEVVLAARQAHFEKLQAWATQAGVSLDVMTTFTKQQEERARQRPSCHQTGRELAIRWVLQRVARVVRDRHDACAESLKTWFEAKQIFANTKDFNKYFRNSQGSIYVSPFSSNRHQGYELGKSVVDQAEALIEALETFAETYSLTSSQYSDEVETLQRLKGLLLGLRISAIEGLVPHDVAQLELEPEDLGDALHDGLKLQLEKDAVESSIVAKAFNVYASLLSGALIMLRREQFFLRTKFSWKKNCELLYVPKAVEKGWFLPKERYAHSKTWQTIFDNELLVDHPEGGVDVEATFVKLVKAWKLIPDDVRKTLLRQLPHDWMFELPVEKDKLSLAEEEACSFESNLVLNVVKGVMTPKRVDLRTCARLVGPSTFKERLNDTFVDSAAKLGDMTLLVNQKFTQDHSTVTPTDLRVELAIPITKNVKQIKSAPTPFKRVIGIDQGEAGLAYAVFDLDEAGNPMATPLTTGTIRIPSIRRLIKGVRSFRKGKQSAQKFNQRFDSTLFVLRENVAGDVCGAIAGLMSRYQAIPVLEYEVKNLASGSKQLELVYKKVNSLFLFSQVDMQNAERQSWWAGANRWEILGLDRKTAFREEGQLKTTVKPLAVYPGASVRAGGTSQICSHCGNNVMALIKRLEAAKFKGAITLDEKGETTLEGHTIALQKPRSKFLNKTKVDPLWRRAKRRNERPDWMPLANRTFKDLGEFRRAVRQSLRRPPKSLMTKDTTQSRYFCPFTSCSHCNVEQHADVNAAINIGRRFLESLSPSKKKTKK